MHTDTSLLIEEVCRMSRLLLEEVHIVITSLGAHGAIWCQRGTHGNELLQNILHKAFIPVRTH